MKVKMSVSTKEMMCPVCKRTTLFQTCDLGNFKVMSCWRCMTTKVWPVLGPEDRKACMEFATKNASEGERKLTYKDLDYASAEVRKNFDTKYKSMVDLLAAMGRKPIEEFFEEGIDHSNEVKAKARPAPRTETPATDNMPAPDMSFGQVLDALKADPHRRFARKGWNGKGMWISKQTPTPKSKMTVPYIYMSTAQGGLVPWLASQTDMLAEDWTEVPQ